MLAVSLSAFDPKAASHRVTTSIAVPNKFFATCEAFADKPSTECGHERRGVSRCVSVLVRPLQIG
jgi:hypothetical protein